LIHEDSRYSAAIIAKKINLSQRGVQKILENYKRKGYLSINLTKNSQQSKLTYHKYYFCAKIFIINQSRSDALSDNPLKAWTITN